MEQRKSDRQRKPTLKMKAFEASDDDDDDGHPAKSKNGSPTKKTAAQKLNTKPTESSKRKSEASLLRAALTSKTKGETPTPKTGTRQRNARVGSPVEAAITPQRSSPQKPKTDTGVRVGRRSSRLGGQETSTSEEPQPASSKRKRKVAESVEKSPVKKQQKCASVVDKTPGKRPVGRPRKHPIKTTTPVKEDKPSHKDDDAAENFEMPAAEKEDIDMQPVPDIKVLVPHASFIVKGIAIDRQCQLLECRNKLCPKKCLEAQSTPSFHCPLCPAKKWAGSDTSQAAEHFEYHRENAVEYKDLLLLMCCCRESGLGKTWEEHWHCPQCGVHLSSKEGMTEHLEMCSGLVEGEERKEGEKNDTAEEELTQVKAEGADASEDPAGLPKNVENSETVPKPLHKSILMKDSNHLSQFHLVKCTDDNCSRQCSKASTPMFHCPLCPQPKWSGFDNKNVRRLHFTTHRKGAVLINKHLLLVCQCCSYGDAGHYHCPNCSQMFDSSSAVLSHHSKDCVPPEVTKDLHLIEVELRVPHHSIMPAKEEPDMDKLFQECKDANCPGAACGSGSTENEQQYHCLLCPPTIFSGDKEATRQHWGYHKKFALTLKEHQLLVCRCKMVGDLKDPRHWHCPMCGDLYASRTSVLLHMKGGCKNVKGKRKRSVIINMPRVQIEANKQRRIAEDWELQQMLNAKAIKFTHVSFVEKLADLPLRKQVNCCQLYHCPLCFTCLHKPAAEVKKHLVSAHWKYRVELQAMKVALLKCSLSCGNKNGSLAATHWHCPFCGMTNPNRSQLASHIIRHERKGCDLGDNTKVRLPPVKGDLRELPLAPPTKQGAVRDEVPLSEDSRTKNLTVPLAEDQQGGEDAIEADHSRVEEGMEVQENGSVVLSETTGKTAVVAPEKRVKSREIFQMVSAALQEEVTAALQGELQPFFFELERRTGVEFLLNDSDDSESILLGKMDKVMLARCALSDVLDLEGEEKIAEMSNILEEIPPLTEKDLEEMAGMRSTSAYQKLREKLSSPWESGPLGDEDPSAEIPLETADSAENTEDGIPVDPEAIKTEQHLEGLPGIDESSQEEQAQEVVDLNHSLDPDVEDSSSLKTKVKVEDVLAKAEEEEEGEAKSHSYPERGHGSEVSAEDKKMYTFDPTTNENLASRTCPTCTKPFPSRSRLLCHLMYTKCGKDTSCFPAALAEEVTNGLTVNDFNCPLCQRTFKKIRDARIHYALKVCQKTTEADLLEKVGKFYMCRFCEFTSDKAHKVFTHENRNHSDQAPHIHECKKCHRSYSSKTLLDRHVSVHEKDEWMVCEHCGKNVRRRYLKEHLRVVHRMQVTNNPPPIVYKEPVKCALCEYTTLKHLNLCNHMLRKHGPRPYACHQCDATFALAMDLNSHIKVIHGKQTEEREEVKCPHCTRVVKRKNLPMHIKHVHEKKKDAFCHVCQKYLATNFTLKAHMELHKSLKERTFRFKCQCGMQFNNKTAFGDHQNTHTLERPYRCDVCLKTFRHLTVLRKHKELHENKQFICKVCKKGFATSQELQAHKYLKEHNIGSANFQPKYRCLCGGLFQQKSLRVHQQSCAEWLNLEQNSQQHVLTSTSALPLASSSDQNEQDKSQLVVYQEENNDGTTVYYIKPEGDNSQVSEEDIQKALLMMQDGQPESASAASSLVQTAGDVEPEDNNDIQVSVQDELVLEDPSASSDLVPPQSLELQQSLDAMPSVSESETMVPIETQSLGDDILVSHQSQLVGDQLQIETDAGAGQEVAAEETPQYLCGYCQKIFSDFNVVQEHMMVAHVGAENDNVQIEVQATDSDI